MFAWLKQKAFDLFWLIFDGLLWLSIIFLLYWLLFSPSGIRLYWQLSNLQVTQLQKLQQTQQAHDQMAFKRQLLLHDSQYRDYESRVYWGLVLPQEDVIFYKDLGEVDAVS